MLKKPYFDFVDFTNAEECFSRYKFTKVYTFDVSQTFKDSEVMLAIKKRLNLGANVYLHEERNNYKLKTASKEGIQNVLSFFKHAPVNGHKNTQFKNRKKKLIADFRFKYLINIFLLSISYKFFLIKPKSTFYRNLKTLK